MLDAETRGLFASIGIEKGKSFKPDSRMKKILTDAVAIANATARAIVWYPRTEGTMEGIRVYPDTDSAWMTAFANKNVFFNGKNGKTMNTDARVAFHYPYTVVSPAMAVTKAGAVIRLRNCVCGLQENALRRIQDLQTSHSSESTGERLLGRHNIRQPDALDAPNKSVLPDGWEPDRRHEEKMRTALTSSTSALWLRRATRITGWRLSPAKAGLSDSGCMVRSRHGSTRPGDPVRSSWSRRSRLLRRRVSGSSIITPLVSISGVLFFG